MKCSDGRTIPIVTLYIGKIVKETCPKGVPVEKTTNKTARQVLPNRRV